MANTLKGIRVKLYPSPKQQEQMNQNIGNVRFVWNQFLHMTNERYRNNPNLPSMTAYSYNYLLPALKEEYLFLKMSEASSLQVVSDTIRESFVQFFNKKRGYPKFKSKRRVKQAYTIKNNRNIQLEDKRIKLPKLGWIRARWSNQLSFDKIKRVTITHSSAGDYIASVLVESENQAFKQTNQSIGLDMGQSTLLIGSNGLIIPTRQYKDYEDKLQSWQRKLSHRQRLAKEKGVLFSEAKNVQKAKRMVAKYHQKIANCRKDYLHKVTTQLVKAYDFIAIEDLSVKKLMKRSSKGKPNLRANHRKIANQSWSTLATMLHYKCEWHNKTFVKVDPRYTTQDCSTCAERTGPKNDLSVRQWICTHCHAHHDRDVNAAQNILKKAIAKVA